MKTVVIANPKGGCGKSTLAMNLGVALSQVHRVCLAEQDQQGTLAKWHKRRVTAMPKTPLHRAGVHMSRQVQARLAPNYDTLIVDTRGEPSSILYGLLDLADLILVPCRTSLADVEACLPLMGVLKGNNRPVHFVINGAVSRAACVQDTVELLSRHAPVIPAYINQSTAYMDCLTTGKVPLELRRTSVSAKRTHALALHVVELLNDR